MKNLVLGVDPSWSGLGWCLALNERPLVAGYERLSKPWREVKLAALLDKWDRLIVDASLVHLVDEDPRPRVVVEQAPTRHKRRLANGRKVSNPGPIAFGLGEVTGAIMQWATRESWLYPWLIPPGSSKAHGWRHWWGYGSRGARHPEAYKAHAVALVIGDRSRRAALDGFDHRDHMGAAGDVAEATLIAIGGTRNNNQGPAGPRGWVRHPTRQPALNQL